MGNGNLDNEKDIMEDPKADEVMRAAYELAKQRLQQTDMYKAGLKAYNFIAGKESANIPVNRGMAGQAAQQLSERQQYLEEIDRALKEDDNIIK